MKETDIEVLRQIVSRTDKTGNQKVEILNEFIELQLKNSNLRNIRQRLINHIETRINYFSGGESMKSLREISTDSDIVKELESLIKIINDDNF